MLGSMSGERIKMAQAMALIVYDFCCSLKIPVTVYGHDSDCRDVNLYSFAGFEEYPQRVRCKGHNIHCGSYRK